MNTETNDYYNEYVSDWYEDHKGVEFEGMEPASYEEWLNNEYQEGA